MDNSGSQDCYLGDIVISGVSCRFPESDNMAEFWENLISGTDMVTEGDGRRWKPGINGLPTRQGLMKSLAKFDAEVFGVPPKQADNTNPQIRNLLEVAYEAIVDAGISPLKIRGSNTGVYIGSQQPDDDDVENENPAYRLTGSALSMMANRLSYFFDFKGPSFVVDTACSATLYALHLAVRDIRSGHIDSALVGGAMITTDPCKTHMFNKLGVLSPDGECRSFDKDANGYVRSEGISAFYIQKRADARRLYCTVVGTKTNSDGFKVEGVTFPSSELQTALLRSVYEETGVNPAEDIAYFEAHATATPVGDSQECESITSVLCKGRKKPLLIGSVKSNMGHCEAASGGASLAKVILAMEKSIIPANLHFNSPNEHIPGLNNGQLQVVNKNTPWEGGSVGVNSFGFGGANAHAILRSHNVEKQENDGCRKARLVMYGGRTAECVESVLKEAQKHSTDLSFHKLLSETANMPVSTFPFRGFTIVNSSESKIDLQRTSDEGRPVWFVFAGMGSQWQGMGRSMMRIDVFKNSILNSDAILKPHGVSLYDMIMKGDDVADDIIKSFVGITAIQVALVDVLKCIGIEPDGMVGHSVGELGCGYADGSLTAKEAVLAAYWRGCCVRNAGLAAGAMAAVGLTWEDALKMCPPGVVPACHNAEESVTVSGPAEAVTRFVKELQEKSIFARMVKSAGVAFHSYFMKNVEESLRKALREVIVPKPRTSRWISSSYPESQWSTDAAKISSSEYHVHNLVSPVLFHDALKHVPNNAVVIEIAPHTLLQSLLKGSLSAKCCIVGLMKRNTDDNVDVCMNALGKCFQHGVNMDILGLFPPVSLPVPRGTPMISSLLKWDHSQNWEVPRTTEDQKRNETVPFTIDLSVISEDRHLLEHKVDGRSVMPGSGYLVLAWKALAEREDRQWDQMPVIFEDVTYNRATFLTPDSRIKFEVRFITGSDKFQVIERHEVVMEGRIRVPDDKTIASSFNDPWYSENDLDLDFVMNGEDIYKEIRVKGYEYGPNYRALTKSTITGMDGRLRWNDDWIQFLDACTHLTILFVDGLVMPTKVTMIIIDPKYHYKCVQNMIENGEEDLRLNNDPYANLRRSGGVIMQEIDAPYVRRSEKKAPVHESFGFVPAVNSISLQSNASLARYAQLCRDVALQTLRRVSCNGRHNRLNHQNILLASAETEETELVKKVSTTNRDTFSDDAAYSLLKVLDEINQKTDDEITPEFLKELISDSADALMSDVLFSNLSHSKFLKPVLQVVTENTRTLKLKLLELFKHDLTDKLDEVFESMPGFMAQSFIATIDPAIEEKFLQKGKATVNWIPGCKAPANAGMFPLVLASHVLRKQTNIKKTIQTLSEMLEDGGFIVIQEVTANFPITTLIDAADLDGKQAFEDIDDRTCGIYCDSSKWRKLLETEGFEIVNEVTDNILSSLFLVKKVSNNEVEKQTFLDVSDLSCGWLDQLQSQLESVIQRPQGENLWLRADGNVSGIIGLAKTLRQEPGGEKIRYIFDMEGSASNLDSLTLKRLVKRDLVTNVYKNGQWGSYRHVPLEEAEMVPSQHAYVNTGKNGALSSLAWFESPLKHDQIGTPGLREFCNVHYASLNFRDVMLATGKLVMDAIPGYAFIKDCLLGMEFSGTDSSGRRVMGMVPAEGLATTIKAYTNTLWPVPDNWTLEEAATVPVAYTTAYYALVIRGNISSRHSVLIHSGSGGVGQAAITIALHYGCKVFTTVGTDEKRKFLKDRFPALKDECIFSSRDRVFEREVRRATSGEGVDLVLNSLADDKLFASVRVLAKHGKFLEIGKYDLAKNSSLGMTAFLKNISFHGILTDSLFNSKNGELEAVSRCFMDGIKSGVVRPLDTTVFGTDEVEEAFRYMAKGKHIGKILIKVRENSILAPIPAIPRCSFYPNKSYIITGGLGGFGLELANWMVYRGAKHIILTSRSGLKTGYQKRMLYKWKYIGADVTVSKKNICSKEEVRKLFQEAKRPVGGIFHLAMVLQDSMLVNQTLEKFQAVCDPKVKGTMNLDEVTREQPFVDNLDWFVGFSSTASGYGNPGQSNYSFANSVLERVIEKRRDDGLPGLAVQWGPVGDVGVFIDQIGNNDTVLGGTIPQRIASCLQSLDDFLNQPEPVVCSYVLVDQKLSGLKHGNKGLVEAVCAVIGIKDSSSVDENKTLGDLGLDSLMGVEIKLLIENDHNISLSAKEIRDLTLKKLRLIENTEDDADKGKIVKSETDVKDEVEKLVPTEIIVKLNNVDTGPPLFIVHNLYGHVDGLLEVAPLLQVPVYGLQRTVEVPEDSIEAAAKFYIQAIEDIRGNHPICLAGYSYGSTIAQEMALQLQYLGHDAKFLILLDASSEWIKKNVEYMAEQLERKGSPKKVQSKRQANENMDAYEEFYKDRRLKLPVFEFLGGDMKFEDMSEEYHISKLRTLNPHVSEEEARISYRQTSNSMNMASKYSPGTMYKGDTLLVATEDSLTFPFTKPDFDLNNFCSGAFTRKVVKGRHIDMLKDDNAIVVADIINTHILSL